MQEIIAQVNWLAVAVGTVLVFPLGWLWYSPKLFGRKWAQGVGVDLDSTGSMAPVLIFQFVANFMLAWVIGVTASTNSLLTAILMVLTIVSLMAANGLFCRKSGYAIMVEVGFVIVMAIIMIVCQGVF
jgi:hypothetical protein